MARSARPRAALAALLVLPVLAACSEEPAAGARDAVVVGMQLEPPVLDPTINAAAAIGQITHLNVYEGLTRIDEHGVVLPGLAESWDVGDDGRVYIFHLRDGVQFSDGTAFDSADVKFTFERNAAPESTNSRKSYFTQMTAIETPDPLTVVVTLAEPSGILPFQLAEQMSVIVAPESAAANRTSPVGTGPFRFERWSPGESVTLVRNALYRDAGSVALARIVFRFIGDAAAQTAALRAGDVDYFPSIGAPEQAAQFENDPDFQVLVGTTEGETILAMNNRRGPLADVRVRRAISHAVDRGAIIEGAQSGYGTPIGSHFAPHHPAYVDLTTLYPYDKETARALLAEAGYADGFRLTMRLPPVVYARRAGEIIAEQVADVGIDIEIEPVEWAVWLESVYGEKNYDLTIVAHVEPLDIGIYADPDYYFQYDSPALGDLIAAANGAVDRGERYGYWREAQRMLAEDAVNVFLFELPKVGVARAGLQGLWRNWPMFINDMAAVRWAPGA